MEEKQLEGKRVFWSNKWDKLWLLVLPIGLFVDALSRSNRYSQFWFWVIIVATPISICYVLYHIFHPKFVWVDTTTTEGRTIQARARELILADFGEFTYSDSGFVFTDKGVTYSFLWLEIQTIFAYKRDLYTEDELNLDVILVNNFRLHLTENIPGWYQFIDRIKLVFPTIDKDFDVKLMFPPFATNLTLVYDSKGRKLEETMKEYYD
jgi:hypothetical protein